MKPLAPTVLECGKENTGGKCFLTWYQSLSATQYQLIKRKKAMQFEFIESLFLYYSKLYSTQSSRGRRITTMLYDIARYDGRNR